MSIFITSDSHFWHKNILDFTNRPFDTVEEMNEGLIASWNNVVTNEDTVYHLGDFSFGGYERTKEILEQLNGKIILHKGNHDRSKIIKKLLKDGLFEEIHEIGQYIKAQKQQMWLTHYPMEIGLRPRKWSISGHIHEDLNREMNQINVGVDSPHYIVTSRPFGEPIPMDELVEHLCEATPIIEDMWQERRKES